MVWTIKNLFWDKEFTIHFTNKYLTCYASAFSFDKQVTFSLGKVDMNEYVFIFKLFGILECELRMFIPLWGKHKTFSLDLGFLGASIFMALEDKRNDLAIEEY